MFRESRPSRLGLTAALLLATVVVVGLGGLSMSRKVSSFQGTGLTIETVDAGLRVTGAADGSDLLAGDIIVLVNGDRAQSGEALERLLRDRADSNLQVLRQTEDEEELVTASHRLPGLQLDWAYLVLALAGIAYLLIGLYTLSRQRSRQTLLFHLWALTSAALYLVTPIAPYDSVDLVFFLVDQACRLLLPPLTLHFFLVFPVRPISLLTRRAAPWLYLPAAVLLALQLDLIFGAGRLAGEPTDASVALEDRIELVVLVAFVLAAALVLWRRLVTRRDPEHGRQAQWIAFGVFGGYTPFLLLYVVPFVLSLPQPAWLDALAVAPLALVPLSFAWALLRYRLWDVTVIARDMATWALTVLLAVLGFSLLSLLIGRAVPVDLGITRGFLNAGALVVVGSLAIPVRQGIGGGLQRLQYRARGRLRALERLGDELLHERDLKRLTSTLLKGLEKGLELERTNLLLDDGDRLAPVREEAGVAAIRLAHVEDTVWDGAHEVLSRAPLADAADTSHRQFAACGYHHVFPLKVRDRRIGLLLVRRHLGGAHLSTDDLSLIRQSLNQAVLAIENANLLEQSQRQLDHVSELRQFSEEIIESSPAGIAVVDGANRIVTANRAFASLVGLSPEAVGNRPLGELIPLDMLPGTGEPPAEVLFTAPGSSGRHLQLSTAEFRGAALDHRVVVAQDVTERVAMKKQLAEKERLAALGAMAAGVAHEVNTPLTGISSYAQMLLDETPSRDPRRRLLRKVERQTFRAARIVNTLLDFARRGRLEPLPVKLAAVVRDTCDALAERLASAGVDVQIDLGDADLIRVPGNETELGQVLANILINAVDAMTEVDVDERRISLTVRNLDDSVLLSVEDTGPGIPATHLERVFEPFFSTRKAAGGTGLGLSISQEIVRRHGGELRASNVESESGTGGCLLTLHLPQMAPGKSLAPEDDR